MLKYLTPALPGRTRRTLIYADGVPITLTFVERLWLALHVCPHDGPLRWSHDGVTFILDDDDFSKRARSLYGPLITSGNVHSLVRNLYRYGFHLSKATINTNGEYTGVTRICFHPQFNRRDPLLLKILSPKTYFYMVDMANVLTAKVAAGVDPPIALTECLLGDDDYHYPDQPESEEECLDGKPKLAISESQMSYHVPLDTSGSCPVKKRRKGSPGSRPEVTSPNACAQRLGKKDVDNDESPKKFRMGQNTLQFLQRLSIGNRWRATTQISAIRGEGESHSGHFPSCSFGNREKKYVVERDCIERDQDESSSSSLPSLEPPKNPFSEHNDLFGAVKKNRGLPMDANDAPIQISSMPTNDVFKKKELGCHQVFSSPVKGSGNKSLEASPYKCLQSLVSKQPQHSKPSTTITHFPRVVMIPHVLTPGGYVPLVHPGGATANLRTPEALATGTAVSVPDADSNGKTEVDNQKGHGQTTDLASLPEPIVIEPSEETMTSPGGSQDDNEDWKSLTDESDSPRLHIADQTGPSPGPYTDEPIEG